MKLKIFNRILLGILALLPCQLAAAENPRTTAATVLTTLRPGHPRLLLASNSVAAIRQLIARDPVAAGIYQSLTNSAEKILSQKPSHYELPDGRRLLSVSRRVLDRVETLAFAFQMTHDRRFVARAWAELDAAAKFQDWNPAHFLDTAEMTHAFALGYDWLWEQWTPAQREILRRAIVDQGLKPALKVYTSGKGWPVGYNNWNQVCNGGIGLGALAIADVEPKLAGEILARAVASIPRAMAFYAPDGGGEEGVTYWDYGSRYNVLFLAGLRSALGTDFGLSRIEGFRQSGDYQIYLSGTGRVSFDFADCGRQALSTPQHFWMGREFNTPRYAAFRYAALRAGQRGGVSDLLWFDDRAPDFPGPALPLDRHFRGVEVVSLRDSWTDGQGFIVALQGGANRGSHRHLDLGSFILESAGVRWIIDSGKESETYQRHVNHVDRWDFYRTRAEGHNTLVFNPGSKMDQSLDGKAVFTRFDSQPDRATAVLDLTSAYAKDASKVTRTFTLQRGKYFTVTDDIICAKPADVWSYFHTEADVKLSPDQRTATLRQDGKTLAVKLEVPANAVFAVLAAEPGPKSPKPAKQASNNDRRKLAVHLSRATSTRITVRFEPD